MDDVHAAEGTAAEQVVRTESRKILDPDSALVRAALDLLTTHVLDGAEGAPALCVHCGLLYPCPTVLHARQVVDAGGVAFSAPTADKKGADGKKKRRAPRDRVAVP